MVIAPEVDWYTAAELSDARKYVQYFTNPTTGTFEVVHDLGTRDVIVSVYSEDDLVFNATVRRISPSIIEISTYLEVTTVVVVG